MLVNNERVGSVTHPSIDIPGETKRQLNISLKTMMCILGLIAALVIAAVTFWHIEKVAPARKFLIATTPVPDEHQYFTLPYHEQKHRQSYLNNTFVQILHHTHNATNMTNCWVCGMIPAHQKKGGTPFIPLPFSHNGSCQAWYSLLFSSARPTVGGLLFRLNEVCHRDKDGYPQVKGTKWESEEYQPDNVSIPHVFTKIRTSVNPKQFVISVVEAKAELCVGGIGSISVGRSNCVITLMIDGINNSNFTASHNTYFICGSQGYYLLPRGWSGVCYVSFLLPPVFIAPASYHKDFKLLNDIAKHSSKRTMSTDEVDQTDTTLQQYVDFNLGLFSFVGALLNSRKIR